MVTRWMAAWLMMALVSGAGRVDAAQAEAASAEVPSASAGADSGSAVPANPFNGMQERVETYEFTAKPKAEKSGEKWIITFASKAACDATVTIVDKDGKIIRHLASGVLGKNAPWPFQQDSLSQKIEWDGLKDDFSKADAAGCKVKVGLGLKAEFDRSIAFDPYLLPEDGKKNVALGVGPDGSFYVGTTTRENDTGRVFDKNGKYVRTFYPPAAADMEKVAAMRGLKLSTTKWGDKVMVTDWMGPCANIGGYGAGLTARPAFAKICGIEMKDLPRPKEIPASTVPGAGAGVIGGKYVRMAVDRERDELYVGDGNTRFIGKTGALDTNWLAEAKSKGLHLGGNSAPSEISVGPDGCLYFRFGISGHATHMARLGHDGKVVPFPKENTVLVPAGGGWWDRIPAMFKNTGAESIYCGTPGGSMTLALGLHVTPNGLIAMCSTYLDQAWGKKMGVTWVPKQRSAVLVFDRDGKLLSGNAIGENSMGQGVVMDRDGNIYAAFGGLMPAGQTKLDASDIAAANRLQGGAGTLVKFRGRGGKYPLNVGPGVKVDKAEVPGSQWAYGGLTGQSHGDCQCGNSRFDLDPYARIFIPSSQLYSITVLDANMNRIARIGRYGNVDDADSACGRIHFVWPRMVAVSDAAMYVGDHGSRRYLRATLGYAVEESAALEK